MPETCTPKPDGRWRTAVSRNNRIIDHGLTPFLAIVTSGRTPGYSGTPLAQKLGIKEASRMLLLGAPEGYAPLLGPLPPTVRFDNRPTHAIDIAHVFVTREEELTEHLRNLRKKLKPDATIWVSW